MLGKQLCSALQGSQSRLLVQHQNLNRKSSNNISLQVIQGGHLILEDNGDNVISFLLDENFTEEVRHVIFFQKNIKNDLCASFLTVLFSTCVHTALISCVWRKELLMSLSKAFREKIPIHKR